MWLCTPPILLVYSRPDLGTRPSQTNGSRQNPNLSCTWIVMDPECCFRLMCGHVTITGYTHTTNRPVSDTVLSLDGTSHCLLACQRNLHITSLLKCRLHRP